MTLKRDIAPGPESTADERRRLGMQSTDDAPHRDREWGGREELKRQLNACYGKPKRRPFMTKGSYYAMGWLTVAGILSWIGYLSLAIYVYAAGGVLFLAFCGPVVEIALRRLAAELRRDHRKHPSLHGHWLATYCPTCAELEE